MSFEKRLRRKRQFDEIRNSYCRKCGGDLIVRKGEVSCKKCGAGYGKVRDRV